MTGGGSAAAAASSSMRSPASRWYASSAADGGPQYCSASGTPGSDVPKHVDADADILVAIAHTVSAISKVIHPEKKYIDFVTGSVPRMMCI